jgi:putative inorganic carbon (HCO3(-)) transporter
VNSLPIQRWFYLSSALFITAAGTALYFENFFPLLIPSALTFLWAAFYKLEFLIFTITFFTPLSLNFEEMEVANIGMYLPTEPLLAGILILFFFKAISGRSIHPEIYKHPVSVVIYAYLTWMALTCITSEMPVVSLKYLTTRLWFVVSFYFIAAHLFRKLENIRLYFLLYLFPLFGVIIYTIVRHSFYGFDKDSSHWVMEPLFKDHTSYGAVLAMYFPVLAGLLLSKKGGTLIRTLLILGFIILTTGLILSYTRAAWISVVGAAGVLVVMLLRINLRTVLLSMTVLGALVFAGWEDIEVSLTQNKQESSDKLEEHVSSISNVSSDASNLERLNRWNCALEMFKERPLMGWGPGTYQFVYAPFQRSTDRTIISTNRGDGGNAHSEYLGPLSEQGVPGMLLVIALIAVVTHTAFQLFYRTTVREDKIIIGSVYLGLVTYFIHGVLNNYLDTDKASIPFWGFIAVIVAMDLRDRAQRSGSEKPAGQ